MRRRVTRANAGRAGARRNVTHVLSAASCVRFFFFSSRRRHTRFDCDWSSDVCSSDLTPRREWWGLLFVLPALAWKIGFNLIPMANAFYISLTSYDLLTPPRFIGVGNYRSEETRLNSSHSQISYAVFCLKKKNKKHTCE